MFMRGSEGGKGIPLTERGVYGWVLARNIEKRLARLLTGLSGVHVQVFRRYIQVHTGGTYRYIQVQGYMCRYSGGQAR